MHIEPVICDGHLPYSWERRWSEGRVGSQTQGAGRGGRGR